MITLSDLCPDVTFYQQLQSAQPGPVTLINTFTAPDGKVDEVIEAWRIDSVFMKASQGFISAQLYLGTQGSGVLVNVAVWESIGALRDAFSSSEFQSTQGLYPDGTVARPHLTHPVAVAGICVA